ncbi:MAG TPA: hypothetical protein VH815_08455 [Acidobacteriota bacterium]
MKVYFTILFLFVSIMFVFAQHPTSSIIAFRYQPEKIKVGTVYHYTKSNLDGSKPSTVSIFIAEPDRLEVYKAEENVIDAADVTAKMDWTLFSAIELDAGHFLKDGTREPVATMQISRTDNSLKVHWKDRDDSVPIGHYPVHIFNFDFISFNYTLRHLRDPEKPFEIGVADPVFDGEGLIVYKGEAEVEYVGDDPCHQLVCRKYRIHGKPFDDKEGFIWVNKKEGHAELIEIPVADNPDWNSFKFELKKIEQMTPAQWLTYKKNNIGRKPFP